LYTFTAHDHGEHTFQVTYKTVSLTVTDNTVTSSVNLNVVIPSPPPRQGWWW